MSARLIAERQFVDNPPSVSKRGSRWKRPMADVFGVLSALQNEYHQ